MGEQQSAWNAVHEAVKENLLTPSASCELCGTSIRLVGHHWRGYSQDAQLDVWWICYECNTALKGHHDGQLSKQDAIAAIRGENDISSQFQCNGITASGNRCKIILIDGRDYCISHQPIEK